MRLQFVLSLAILSGLCLASKGQSEGKFEGYHAQSQSTAPLKLDDSIYEDLTALPRNYSVVVLLTALEARFGCRLCKEFQPEWDLLGKSWMKGDKEGKSRTLYGTLEFTDGKGTFQKVVSSS